VSAHGQPPQALREEFDETRAALLKAHRAWASLAQKVRDDPWAEAKAAPQLAELESRRAMLLDHLGRIGLTWMLRGGRMELFEAGERPAANAQPLPPSPLPPSPLASAQATERLSAAALGPSWTAARQSAPAEAEPPPIPLTELLEPLEQPPGEILDANGVAQELRRLSRGIHTELTAAWTALPRETQRGLVGEVVARARRVQDDLPEGLMPESLRPELDRVFSSMTAFSKREQPGFVFGLMRSHKPVHGSWLDDARAWRSELQQAAGGLGNPEQALDALRAALDDPDHGAETRTDRALACLRSGVSPDDARLVALLTEHSDLLRQHTEFKKTRKAIREAVSEDAAFNAEMKAPASALPSDWAHWPQVRGKRASIIGGDLREEARQRIESTFGFELVDWVTTDHARNLQVLASAVRGGSVEFVIVLRRFIGHDVDRILRPACQAAGVPWVSVDKGYGVSQIRLAIERFLAVPEGAAPAD
jgi:hypothetical protein